MESFEVSAVNFKRRRAGRKNPHIAVSTTSAASCPCTEDGNSVRLADLGSTGLHFTGAPTAVEDAFANFKIVRKDPYEDL